MNQDRVDKARIKLFTSRDMTFRVSPEKGIRTIPAYTQCEKVPYTKKIKDYLVSMEDTSLVRPSEGTKAVCVMLEGMLRYVWRTDVLTMEEYDVLRRQTRKMAVGIFKERSKRTTGKGDQE